jgi:hypothetical protein
MFRGEKVRTTKITMLKTKKNIEKFGDDHYIKMCPLVDHYYDITTTTKKKDFQRCDFTYGIKKDHNVENQKYLFKQIPMAYYLWIPRPVGPWGVWLGSIRLG